jgi:hypothetical protein
VGSLAADGGRVAPAGLAGVSAGERPHSPPPARSSSMYDRQQLSTISWLLFQSASGSFSPHLLPSLCVMTHTIHQDGYYSKHACCREGCAARARAGDEKEKSL